VSGLHASLAEALGRNLRFRAAQPCGGDVLESDAGYLRGAGEGLECLGGIHGENIYNR